MNNTSQPESTSALSDAIRTLEDYSKLIENEEKESSVEKTMRLVKSLFSTSEEPARKTRTHQRHPPKKEEVLHAVDYINRHRFLIAKLKSGDDIQQKLAESLMHSIETYNQSIAKRVNHCLSKRGLSRLLSLDKEESALPKISLLKTGTVRQQYPEQKTARNESTEGNAKAEIPVPKQYAELFHMKALSLLERYGIASNQEARIQVKTAPINTAAGGTTCTMTQTLKLFPGQTVTVSGSSALDPKTGTIRTLFPDSFFLTLDSHQTGFPHPSQRAGWALAPQLLPDSPQRIDLLLATAPLFEQKAKIIAELLPQGKLIKQAKTLRTLKSNCFQKHGRELLGKHRTLALAIVRASPGGAAQDDAEAAINRYFDLLENDPQAFETLSDTHQTVRDHFITTPHHVLLEAILKGKSTDFGSSDPMTRYHHARTVLDKAFEAACNALKAQIGQGNSPADRIKLEYISHMGMRLGSAAKQIVLQYLSEDLIFPAPELVTFEKKVQASAYRQLADFIHELERPAPHEPRAVLNLMNEAIDADIRVFTNDTPPVYPQELADYFNKRYASLSSI